MIKFNKHSEKDLCTDFDRFYLSKIWLRHNFDTDGRTILKWVFEK